MIQLTGTKKEQTVRKWFNDRMKGKVPMNSKVIDIFRKFEVDHPNISYGCLNGTIKKIVAEGNIDVIGMELHKELRELGIDDLL